MANYTTHDRKAMAVAYLTAQRWKQDDIRKALGLRNQAEVSRLLSFARTNDWIVQTLKLPSNVNHDEIREMAFPHLNELRECLEKLAIQHNGVKPTEVHVLYSGPEGTDYAERLVHFGRLAAERIETLLSNATTCAVAWGQTINSTLDGLKSLTPKKRKEMTFMPVSGEPMNHIDPGVSPSMAAKRLAEFFGCSDNVLSLLSVAARIPSNHKHHASTIREFMACCHDYERIFGGKEPLIDNVDAIISGIGDARSSENDAWFRETQEAEAMKKNDLNCLTVGNIGGVWLPKDSANSKHLDKVADINGRWLGIQKNHFETCARVASPGVLLLAVGERKSGIVRRAVGLVNHLLIDHTLAQAIVDEG